MPSRAFGGDRMFTLYFWPVAVRLSRRYHWTRYRPDENTMKFGITIPTDADSWRLVRRAEELGFHHAWFYDTQMLSADCFVAMAACAIKTTRIRLGTGVLIPSNRIAPVAANAFATRLPTQQLHRQTLPLPCRRPGCRRPARSVVPIPGVGQIALHPVQICVHAGPGRGFLLLRAFVGFLPVAFGVPP